MKRKPVITTVDLLTFYYLPVYNQNGMNKHSIILIYAICKIVDNFMNSDFTSLLNHMVHLWNLHNSDNTFISFFPRSGRGCTVISR